MHTFNPLGHPIGLMYPTRLARSPWTGHVPFALTLIDLLRPAIVVELGTSTGVSYAAFCQAIAHLRLTTRAFAVAGRAPPAVNGPAAFEEFRAFHDPLYADFSRLVASTSDEALPHFPDSTIDLLHIDGEPPYEVVRLDFAAWLPKMSPRGVVLLHGINRREAGAGVWRLWHEIQARYPSFDLLHEHGLGLVAVGPEVPEGLRPLLDSTDGERVALRDFYAQLGRRAAVHEVAAAFEKRLTEDQARHDAQLAALHAQHEGQLAALHAQQQAEIQEHEAWASRLEAAHAQALAHERTLLAETRAGLADAREAARLNQAQVEETSALLEVVRREVAGLRAYSRDLEIEIQARTAAHRELEGIYHELQAEARRIRASEEGLRAALEQTQASLAWRLAHFLARCSHKLAPRGTRRRRAFGTARRAVLAVRHSRASGILSRTTARLSQLLW
jgi:hypothetical protein